jgi:hypothetical protein
VCILKKNFKLYYLEFYTFLHHFSVFVFYFSEASLSAILVVSGNSAYLPINQDLAAPIVGIFRITPKWEAIPNFRGWAIPRPYDLMAEIFLNGDRFFQRSSPGMGLKNPHYFFILQQR